MWLTSRAPSAIAEFEAFLILIFGVRGLIVGFHVFMNPGPATFRMVLFVRGCMLALRVKPALRAPNRESLAAQITQLDLRSSVGTLGINRVSRLFGVGMEMGIVLGLNSI